MKKYFSVWLITVLCCTMLAACNFDQTTMDQGHDTDGKAGETNQTMQSDSGTVMDDTKKAIKDVTNSAGNAVNDVVDGAGRAMEDVTNGSSESGSNMNQKTK